jgi:hypothetical protein
MGGLRMKRALLILLLLFGHPAVAGGVELVWKLDVTGDVPLITTDDWPTTEPFPLRAIPQWRQRSTTQPSALWWEARLIAVRDNGRSAVVATPWVPFGHLEANGERVFGDAASWADSVAAEFVGRYPSSLSPDRMWIASRDHAAALVVAGRASQLVRQANGSTPLDLGELILAERASVAARFAALEANRESGFRERVVIYTWKGESVWSSPWYEGDHDYLYLDPSGSKVHFAGYQAGTYCYDGDTRDPVLMSAVPPYPRHYSGSGRRMLVRDYGELKLMYFDIGDFCAPELLVSRDLGEWLPIDAALSDDGSLAAVALQGSKPPRTRKVLLLDETLATLLELPGPGPVRFHDRYLVRGMFVQSSLFWLDHEGRTSLEIYDLADLSGTRQK